MQCPYVGLTNQGATCYMNSYLQFIYMTSEFRRFIFSNYLKPENKSSEKHNIPYQLQKLFAKLSLRKNRQISTKELTTAFHWGSEETFAEHDVCEFGKLLFDAISASLNQPALERFKELGDLFEGQLVHYIVCQNCKTKTSKTETFCETNLIIDNEFEKVSFKKLENSLLQNIKQVKLDGNNKYFCDSCNSKQVAIKGCELVKLPQILLFSHGRFTFDPSTCDRKKVNAYFEFPLQFEPEKFVGDYDKVLGQVRHVLAENDTLTDKSSQQNSLSFATESLRVNVLSKKGKQYKNAQVTSQTKLFLQQAKKRKTKPADIVIFEVPPKQEVKQVELPDRISEPQLLHSGDKFEFDGSEKPSDGLEEAWAPNFNRQNIASATDHESNRLLDTKTQKFKKPDIECDHIMQTEPSKKELGIPIDLPSQSHSISQLNCDPSSSYTLYAVFIHKGTAHQGHYYVYIKSFENNLWYLFDDYLVREVNVADVLKDGFGGQGSDISAYMTVYHKISDGFLQKGPNKTLEETYKKEVNVAEIQTNKHAHSDKLIVGNPQLNFTHVPDHDDCIRDSRIRFPTLNLNNNDLYGFSTNDEGLMQLKRGIFERESSDTTTKSQVELQDVGWSDCPSYLRDIIEHEMKIEEEQTKKVFQSKSILSTVKHKLFYKLQCKIVEVEISKSVDKLIEASFQAFEVQDYQNCRLRLYNKIKDEMQDLILPSERSLKDAKLHTAKTLIIEVKRESEEFEPYNPSQTVVRLLYWSDILVKKTDYESKFEKLELSKQASILELRFFIESLNPDRDFKHTHIVLKKTLKNGIIKGEDILKDEKWQEKSLGDYLINTNTSIFVDFSEFRPWEKFFDGENSKIVLNFNYPVEESSQVVDAAYCHKLKIDLDATVNDLKKEIRLLLGIPEERDFIIKRGGKSGIEFKETSKSIRTFCLIPNFYLYLAFGKSTAFNDVKTTIYVCKSILDPVVFNFNFEIQYIGEYSINPMQTPKRVLDSLADKLPNILNTLKTSLSIEQETNALAKDDKSLESKTLFFEQLEKRTAEYGGSLDNKLLFNDLPVRIREKSGTVLTKVYKNGPMKPQGMIDRKKLVIELLSPILEKNQILIYYTVIDPRTLFLSPVKELIVNKSQTLENVGMAVIEQGLNIGLDSLTATKIRDLRTFFVEDIIAHRFYDMNATDKLIILAPFYLDVDGCLFM